MSDRVCVEKHGILGECGSVQGVLTGRILG